MISKILVIEPMFSQNSFLRKELSKNFKNVVYNKKKVNKKDVIRLLNDVEGLVLGLQPFDKDVIKALQWASDNGMETCLLTAKPISNKIKGLTQVILGVDYYHTAECLSLLLQYQLTHGSGNECPPIGQNSPEDLKELNWQKGIRKHSYPDEQINLGIDFDGVIHKNSKGFYDGTIYDDPIEGSYEALEKISKKYTVIMFTAKAKPDRGLVNGKTGTELVWEWLKKYKFDKYISKVTSEKPRAVAYIDDKAIKFNDWDSCLKDLEKGDII